MYFFSQVTSIVCGTNATEREWGVRYARLGLCMRMSNKNRFPLKGSSWCFAFNLRRSISVVRITLSFDWASFEPNSDRTYFTYQAAW